MKKWILESFELYLVKFGLFDTPKDSTLYTELKKAFYGGITDYQYQISCAFKSIGKVSELLKTTGSECIEFWENYFKISDEKKDEQRSIFKKEIQKKIFDDIFFPPHWIAEGIKKPNLKAKENTFILVMHLYDKYDLKPHSIQSTKEEGIYLLYENPDLHCRSLVIEVYNDNEIGTTIRDNEKKEILHHEDIVNMDFEKVINAYITGN